MEYRFFCTLLFWCFSFQAICVVCFSKQYVWRVFFPSFLVPYYFEGVTRCVALLL